MDYKALIKALTPCVNAAGKALLDIKSGGVQSSLKPDGSPVTIADKVAEEILLSALHNLCPKIPVVSEENIKSHQLIASSCFFLVDPLDGTKEFLKADKSNAFTVNIALIENSMPTMGLVFAPAFGKFYWGYKGGGAYLREKNHIKRIKVRAVPSSGPTAVTSASHLDDDTTNWLSKRNIEEITTIGSSLKFTIVASGLADVYPRFGPTMEWDTAAGDAILRAAGGNVLNPDGRVYCYGKTAYQNTPFIAYGQSTKL